MSLDAAKISLDAAKAKSSLSQNGYGKNLTFKDHINIYFFNFFNI
jgi:hypothetical protein